MNHDQARHEDQMTRLMQDSMRSVTASEEIVTGGISRGRRLTRRRRAAQGIGVGAAATAVAVAAVTLTSSLSDRDDQRSAVAGNPADATPSATAATTPQPAGQPTPKALPNYLQRAQELLLGALPSPLPDPGYIARVDYDPDGRGLGEIVEVVSLAEPGIVGGQNSRCERVAASRAPDACVDTGTGWIFTHPSVPDVSGRASGLVGMEATYIFRDGRVVTLTAYNAVKATLGGEPTRRDPVLDSDDMVELLTRTEWFG